MNRTNKRNIIKKYLKEALEDSDPLSSNEDTIEFWLDSYSDPFWTKGSVNDNSTLDSSDITTDDMDDTSPIE